MTAIDSVSYHLARSTWLGRLSIMTQVNVQDAKTRLSDLLARAERGEEIVIARSGVPVARLVPLTAPPPRVFGGETFAVPADFDAALSETELAAWE